MSVEPAPAKEDKSKKYGETLRHCEDLAMKATGPACKVFLALKRFANIEGYCFPFVRTLMEKTGIKKKDTVFNALTELEEIGVLDRAPLVSRKGRNSPNLYRLGAKIERVPQNIANHYVLGSRRRGSFAYRRGPVDGDLATCDVPPDGTTEVPLNGISAAPLDGTIEVPRNGTQNYSIESQKETTTPNSELLVRSPSTQNQLVVVSVELEERDGETVIPSMPAFSAERLPPVLAFFKRHGHWPPYVLDSTHVLFDEEGKYRGYVGRDGKRYDEWNSYESIGMRDERLYRESLRLPAGKEPAQAIAVQSSTEVSMRSFTKEEKMQVLRSGTKEFDVAERWSKASAIPAFIFLIPNAHDREGAYKAWKSEKPTS